MNKEYTAESNPAAIEWPTDPWGLTTELKRAIIRTGSRICNGQDKLDLVNEVLKIGFLHLSTKVSKKESK